MKRQKVKLAIALIFFLFYVYIFYLSLWGKPLYDGTGNVGYIIAFHLLAIVNYFSIGVVVKTFNVIVLLSKRESFFLLHGSLISVFPYAGYLYAGIVLMAAALISSAINSRSS
jgi:hypothetical protein